ncbi:MAG: DUF3313 domain-containing protein [Burkholderiales bacterium]
MFRSIASRMGVATLAVVLSAGLAANANAQGKGSGFLKDYSQLKTDKDPLGNERRIWVSPKFTRANYQTVLIEPLGYYPAPQPSEQVSMGALNDMRAYADSALRKAFATVIPLASAPGPGVARIRWAVTAAAVEGFELKPYQLVPVALIFTGAKEAAGQGSRKVKLAVEAEMTDSVTGEVLLRAVREAQGVNVKEKTPLTLKVAQPQIDKWAESVQQTLAARMKQDGK